MATFYVLDVPNHVTYYRYLIEADSEEEALRKFEEDDPEPYGFWDADNWPNQANPGIEVDDIITDAKDRDEAEDFVGVEFRL